MCPELRVTGCSEMSFSGSCGVVGGGCWLSLSRTRAHVAASSVGGHRSCDPPSAEVCVDEKCNVGT